MQAVGVLQPVVLYTADTSGMIIIFYYNFINPSCSVLSHTATTPVAPAAATHLPHRVERQLGPIVRVQHPVVGSARRLVPVRHQRAQTPACILLPHYLQVSRSDCQAGLLLAVHTLSTKAARPQDGHGSWSCASAPSSSTAGSSRRSRRTCSGLSGSSPTTAAAARGPGTLLWPQPRSAKLSSACPPTRGCGLGPFVR